mmetsp:Transcript_8305/g.26408  ORF Transcript_8305/g.26408 Transcript_8305/m.26408 type:complete len:477 (+) Transcript_8305:1167-2597(+)
MAQQLHHDVAPRDGTHRHAAGLDDVALAHVLGDVGEAQEDLHLGDHPPVHGPAVDLDVEGPHLDLAAEVVDVVVLRRKVIRGQHAEVCGADGLVVLLELLELLLQRHALGGQREGALHDGGEGVREERGALPHGAHQLVGVRLAELQLQLGELLLRASGEALEGRQHRADRVPEELLDLPLHEAGEVLETDGGQVLAAQVPVLHLPDVLPALLVAELRKVARALGVVRPPREGHGEADQVAGEVAIALDPLGHVVAREVPVVLVELVADEDRALELRVDLAAPRQRRHGRGVAGLLHAQHHVPLVRHEGHVQLLDLRGEVLPRLVVREVAEAREVHDLHVDAPRRLDPHVDGLGAHGGAEVLVSVADDLHDRLDGVLHPLAGRAAADVPLGALAGGDVPELQDRRPAAAEGPGAEVELLAGQGLDEPALAHRLLADEDELGHGEVDDAELVLHLGLDIPEQVEQLALGGTLTRNHL